MVHHKATRKIIVYFAEKITHASVSFHSSMLLIDKAVNGAGNLRDCYILCKSNWIYYCSTLSLFKVNGS